MEAISKVHIIYDGTAGIRDSRYWQIPKEIKSISQEVSFSITAGNKQWEDTPEGFSSQDKTEILELFKTPGTLKTAQPSPGKYQAAINKASDNGAEKIVIFTMDTAKDDGTPMSGSKATAEQAAACAKDERDLDVYVTSCQTTSIALGLLVLKACEDILDCGIDSAQEIVDLAHERSKKLHVAQVIDGLGHLHAGGRISERQKIIGGILGVRPVIGLKDGKIVPLGKAKGETKAYQLAADYIAKSIGDKTVRLAFASTAGDSKLELLRRSINNSVKSNQFESVFIGESPWVLNVHLGPGAAVAALEEEQ